MIEYTALLEDRVQFPEVMLCGLQLPVPPGHLVPSSGFRGHLHVCTDPPTGIIKKDSQNPQGFHMEPVTRVHVGCDLSLASQAHELSDTETSACW